MKAKDIMTSPVLAVSPDTTVEEIAALLFERRISAVPVLENGRLVGILSEADLLRRHEIGTDCPEQSGSWWQRLLRRGDSMEEYIKSHARRARDVMTREVIAVTANTPLAEVADLLHARRIKRVPVLERGRLAGIVSRSDIVRALAVRRGPERPTAKSSDDGVRKRLLAELSSRPWWHADVSNVSVENGVVRISGIVDLEKERDAARVAAENIPGVRRVEDNRILLSNFTSV